MEKYKVMLYPRAFRDIDGIYAYIALEKLAPENAKGQTDRIWAAIESLASFPSAHQDRQVGRYAGRGYVPGIAVMGASAVVSDHLSSLVSAAFN